MTTRLEGLAADQSGSDTVACLLHCLGGNSTAASAAAVFAVQGAVLRCTAVVPLHAPMSPTTLPTLPLACPFSQLAMQRGALWALFHARVVCCWDVEQSAPLAWFDLDTLGPMRSTPSAAGSQLVLCEDGAVLHDSWGQLTWFALPEKVVQMVQLTIALVLVVHVFFLCVFDTTMCV